MKLYLNLGTGGARPGGFINPEGEPGSHFKHDWARKLPWDDASAEGIYCENLIEGLSQASGLHLLRECRRILVPGGRLRIATHDLDSSVAEYTTDVPNPEWIDAGYDWIDNSCERFNIALRGQGRQWLYNQQELVRLADMMGLIYRGRCEYGVSDKEEFANLEQCPGSRLIVEFEKPSAIVTSEGLPMVSIAIPAYNPKYFTAALTSALTQTYPNCEIIVCDDCPGREIEQQVVRAIEAGGQVRYFRNQERLFGRRNMIKCLDQARGTFIKFLNDDDLLHPECIARMMKCFQEHPAVKLVTSYRQRIDDKGEQLPDIVETTRPVPSDSVIEGLSLANTLVASGANFIGEPTTVLFRKADVINCKPDFMSFANFPVRAINDMATWINLLLKGDAVYLTSPLSYFRIHAQQAQQNLPDIGAYFNEAIKRIRACWERFDLARDDTPGVLKIRPLADGRNIPWLQHDVRAVYGIVPAAETLGDDFTRYQSAVRCSRQGDADQGISILKQLAAADTKVWQVYSDLGLWHFSSGRHQEAIDCLHKAVELEGTVSLPVSNLVAVLSTLLLDDAAQPDSAG